MKARALRKTAPWVVSGLLLAAAAGCGRGRPSRRPPIHLNPNMDHQPKYLPQGESPFFYNGSTSQPPVEGTIARGELPKDEEIVTGKSLWGFYIENPYKPDERLMARGQDRFQIYCTPCHGSAGDGNSMLLDRAKVESADLHEERIRQMPDGQLYEIITNGSGLMPAYRYPISLPERWAIVAYIRVLQESTTGGPRP